MQLINAHSLRVAESRQRQPRQRHYYLGMTAQDSGELVLVAKYWCFKILVRDGADTDGRQKGASVKCHTVCQSIRQKHLVVQESAENSNDNGVKHVQSVRYPSKIFHRPVTWKNDLGVCGSNDQ
jgi:hypothetical protein